MKKNATGTEELIKAVDAQIKAAEDYDESSLAEDRKKALEYYRGVMTDMEAEDGRSKAVSRDLSDVAGQIIPDLMEMFASSDVVWDFGASKQGDEDYTTPASDYINNLFMRRLDGYRILLEAFTDGLLESNGIIKVWWDSTPEYRTEQQYGLNDMDLAMIEGDKDFEDFIEHEVNPETGLLDVKIKMKISDGQVRVEALPRENFLISASATSMKDTPFASHNEMVTRSDLVKRGYDRNKVYGINSDENDDADAYSEAREGDIGDNGEITNKATEEIEVFECYIQFDADDDGIAEWRQVIIAGEAGKRAVLSNEEWPDDLPFVDLTPSPKPHRFVGSSLYDIVADIQQRKTALTRGALDNIYWQNNPERIVDIDKVTQAGLDALESPRFGQLISSENGTDSVKYLERRYMAGNCFAMLEYEDASLQKRTGVSEQSAGLNPEALQNQSATSANLQNTAQKARVKHLARNMAMLGLAQLGKALLKLVVAHQSRPAHLYQRQEWVEMIPADWSPDMDVIVNTGLGSGSRERDMAMLGAILTRQEAIIGQYGPDNPIVSVPQYSKTLERFVEAGGMREPAEYFKTASEDDVAAYLQAQQEKPPEQDQAKLAEIQLKTEQAKAEMELKRWTIEQELILKREMAMAEIQLKFQGLGPLETEVRAGGMPG
ncbi:MAG: hypothetical protein JKY96_04830 [Phycisphaerales bacterium]|nr:hypothetical protein [Phycisphaerales bacterium]